MSRAHADTQRVGLPLRISSGATWLPYTERCVLHAFCMATKWPGSAMVYLSGRRRKEFSIGYILHEVYTSCYGWILM